MEKHLEKTTSFNEILLDSIDEVLTVIGNSIKLLIYTQIKNSLGIGKEEIPDQLEGFTNVLQRILGAGARQIELQLIKQIQRRTGINFPAPIQNSKFIDCITFIKQEYEKSKY